MKEPRIVQVNAASPIDPKEIPKTVGMILAQTVLPSLQEAYANPEIYADFLRWKAERAQKGDRTSDKP